ncbi:Os11g0166450 [Oryza sativa Japonica Group]|uniref:Os11g0166450 protein n=1 Tax=Oryza sativa subsp. japonica TaxID=39947 RepID=A0A0P0XZQ2_ORYSJ|nr:hypothetical protein EE612_053704 [Oryza sativa]BAT12829.1 Os11g0166450 [Oryza sativa Japonica Group]
MAAATGYGDAPTADDLAAYDQLLGLRHTRHMAEVFAVRLPHAAGLRRPPPCGTISFCGGNHCNDVIYSRSRTDDSTYPPPCDTHVKLPPCRQLGNLIQKPAFMHKPSHLICFLLSNSEI